MRVLCCALAGGQDRAAGVYEMTGEREAASELSLKANGMFVFAFVRLDLKLRVDVTVLR